MKPLFSALRDVRSTVVSATLPPERWKSSRMWLNVLIVLLGVTLPWFIKANSAVLIGVAIATIFVFNRSMFNGVVRNEWLMVGLPLAYYALIGISIVNTEQISAGLFYFEKAVSFVFLPFCLLIASRAGLSQRALLNGFSWSLVVASFTCLVMAVYNNHIDNQANNYPDFFINHWFYSYYLLSENIGIHPAYFACFISLALFHVILNTNINVWLKTVAVVYFFNFIVLLSSRNILFVTLVILAVLFVRRLRSSFSWKLVIVAVAAAALLVVSVSYNDVARDRLREVLNSGTVESDWGNFPERFKKWDASWQVIRSNPLLGTGPGDVQIELNEIYLRNNWNELLVVDYNCHNQFLQTAAGLGILGFAVLCTTFVISFLRAFRTRHTFYLIFLFTFLSFSLSESTLEVQKGIIYFMLFNCVLYFTGPMGERLKTSATK